MTVKPEMIRKYEMNMPGFTAEGSLYKSVVHYKFNGNVRFQGPTGQTQALASSSIVAISSPNGLIASTGNLYWTSKIYDEFGPFDGPWESEAAAWRVISDRAQWERDNAGTYAGYVG